MERTSQFFHETLSFYEAINRKGRARHLRFLQGDGRQFTKRQKIPEGKVSARDEAKRAMEASLAETTDTTST